MNPSPSPQTLIIKSIRVGMGEIVFHIRGSPSKSSSSSPPPDDAGAAGVIEEDDVVEGIGVEVEEEEEG